MRRQVFSDKEIQGAFHLAYLLHPNMAVAYSIALDAIDRYFLQKRLQERRPKAKKQPFKNQLSDPALLQTSLYLASDLWERDQERLLPRKTPYYKPDVNDLIVRYVKFLIWETMERSSSYVAVGIGSFLYTYRTSEINNLAPDHFKDDNIRRIKAGIINAIRKRFEQHNIAPEDSPFLITRVPTDSERALVHGALTSFAPWVIEHASASSAGAPILEIYFGYESEKSEWERNHALIDLGCAGLRLLIQEFNANSSRENDMRLDNPDEKLEIPDFGPHLETDKKGDRFNPPALSETELISLRRSLEQNQRRRESYRPGRVRICVDGKEQTVVWQNLTCEEFTVPSSASYIEVYGDDPSGELLLAVVPLTNLDFEYHEEIEIPIEYCDELVFSVFVTESSEGNGKFSVRVQDKNLSQTELDNQPIRETKASSAESTAASTRKHFQSTSWTSPTPLRRLLWFFAGAESQILEQEVCRTERSKYSLIGTSVLISSAVAAVGGGYALYLVLEVPSLAVVLGLIWSLLILTFDRFLVLNTRRADEASNFVHRVRHFLTHFAPRFLLASVVALLIAEPLLLRLFRGEIRYQVEVQRQGHLLAVTENAKHLFPEIADLDGKIDHLESEIRKKQDYRDSMYQQIISEREGTGGTGKMGAGPVLRERLQQLRNVEYEIDTLRWKNEKLVDNYRERLTYFNGEKDKEIKRMSASVAQSDGLLSHLSALASLKASNKTVQQVSWLLLLLIILVEAMPILMKVSFAKGLYESILESTVRYNYERYEQELATRPEKEVEEKIEDLKNVVNFYARSRVAQHRSG
jgi:Domain of unknown function (DUF4407)